MEPHDYYQEAVNNLNKILTEVIGLAVLWRNGSDEVGCKKLREYIMSETKGNLGGEQAAYHVLKILKVGLEALESIDEATLLHNYAISDDGRYKFSTLEKARIENPDALYLPEKPGKYRVE
jgi:hypothetical protein